MPAFHLKTVSDKGTNVYLCEQHILVLFVTVYEKFSSHCLTF